MLIDIKIGDRVKYIGKTMEVDCTLLNGETKKIMLNNR